MSTFGFDREALFGSPNGFSFDKDPRAHRDFVKGWLGFSSCERRSLGTRIATPLVGHFVWVVLMIALSEDSDFTVTDVLASLVHGCISSCSCSS